MERGAVVQTGGGRKTANVWGGESTRRTIGEWHYLELRVQAQSQRESDGRGGVGWDEKAWRRVARQKGNKDRVARQKGDKDRVVRQKGKVRTRGQVGATGEGAENEGGTA